MKKVTTSTALGGALLILLSGGTAVAEQQTFNYPQVRFEGQNYALGGVCTWCGIDPSKPPPMNGVRAIEDQSHVADRFCQDLGFSKAEGLRMFSGKRKAKMFGYGFGALDPSPKGKPKPIFRSITCTGSRDRRAGLACKRPKRMRKCPDRKEGMGVAIRIPGDFGDEPRKKRKAVKATVPKRNEKKTDTKPERSAEREKPAKPRTPGRPTVRGENYLCEESDPRCARKSGKKRKNRLNKLGDPAVLDQWKNKKRSNQGAPDLL